MFHHAVETNLLNASRVKSAHFQVFISLFYKNCPPLNSPFFPCFSFPPSVYRWISLEASHFFFPIFSYRMFSPSPL